MGPGEELLEGLALHLLTVSIYLYEAKTRIISQGRQNMTVRMDDEGLPIN